MKKLITPYLENKSQTIYGFIWFGFFIISWLLYSYFSSSVIFPSISSVLKGFTELYNEGLITHVGRSLGLFMKAALIAISFSVFVIYISPIPILKPISRTISKLRFLPFAGISYYLAMVITDARMSQVAILSIFTSLFLVTSLEALLKDLGKEIDHAKTLGCSNYQITIEVIIKGKLDYVVDSVRQNLAIIWMSIVMVESMLTAYGGLGFLIKNGERNGNYGRTIAIQIVILLIGVTLDYSINKLRKVFFKYSNF